MSKWFNIALNVLYGTALPDPPDRQEVERCSSQEDAPDMTEALALAYDEGKAELHRSTGSARQRKNNA
jgi:hypothetical protein